MRKEIGWNVGMHSHPKFLNNLSMNEMVNAAEKKMTITHTHKGIDHPENEDVIV